MTFETKYGIGALEKDSQTETLTLTLTVVGQGLRSSGQEEEHGERETRGGKEGGSWAPKGKDKESDDY